MTLAPEHLLSIATIVAVFAGPVLAVWVTRIIDDERDIKSRKMEIFRTLMRTRKIPIHFEHVGALNLVEVEFSENQNVIAAWRSYLKNLGDELPPIEQKERYDKLVKEREALLTKLIHEIAIILKIKVQQLDILEGNYIPQGWHDDDWEQRIARRHLISVLSGRTPLAVRTDLHQTQNSPYPPPPTA